MNKKFVQQFLIAFVFILTFAFCNITYAVYSTSDNNGYNTPVYASELNFSAVLNSSGDVEMSWDEYAPNGFNYYKVIRSTTNANPVYPDDGYIYYTSDSSVTTYIDTSVPSGDVYYRVCSIASPERYCSIVSKITGDGTSSYVTEPESADEIPDTAELLLTANMEDDGIDFTWDISGNFPQGFKLCISDVNENPTYPVMDGDSYRYFTDSSKRSYKEVMLTAGKTYHFRICQYYSGQCLAYSNNVSIDVPSDYSKTDDTDKSGEAVMNKGEESQIQAKVQGEFTDAVTHQYKNAIEYLKDESIAEGYSDGTFKPDYTINRAEFMKIVMGAKYGTEISDDSNCFNDVVSDWYAPYICLAKKKGIVGGYTDGTFKPANSINFAESAKILAEVYGLDVQSGGAWYEGYVKALQDDNYIPSTVSSLDKNITRAEMAELIWRIREQKKDQQSSELLQESTSSNTADYSGWATYSGDGFTFRHPNWYQGEKWGWDLLTDELDFYQNLSVPNYMDVDSYLSVYTTSGSNLSTSIWFSHPLVSATETNINGVPALKRHYRAPRGTVVNGRTTGENENITIYTYELDGKVAVLQYFNAYGSENYNVETFYKIAESFVIR